MGVKLDNIEIKKGDNKSYLNEISFTKFLNKDISISKSFSDKKKFRFYKDLSLLVSAGLDLRRSLELAIEGEKNLKTQTIYREIVTLIINGLTFSESLKKVKVFSEYEYYSIKIGEESGTITTILNDLAKFYESRIEFKRKMISTFSYPIIVLFTALLAIVFMLNFIVPIFEDAFKRFGGELPYLTQQVLALSDFIQDYGFLILLILTSIVVFFYSQRKKSWFKSNLSVWLIRIPIIGEIALKTHLARFSHSMSLLIRVNNPLVSSISLIRKMTRFYLLEIALVEIEKDIMNGYLLHQAMEKHNFFPKRMTSLIKVAEEVNKLETVFTQIQIQYEDETQESSKTIGSLLEPFLIIFIGFFVGLILIAMYLPLFELGSGIQ